jgi:hypothetical protein
MRVPGARAGGVSGRRQHPVPFVSTSELDRLKCSDKAVYICGEAPDVATSPACIPYAQTNSCEVVRG